MLEILDKMVLNRPLHGVKYSKSPSRVDCQAHLRRHALCVMSCGAMWCDGMGWDEIKGSAGGGGALDPRICPSLEVEVSSLNSSVLHDRE